MIEINVGTQCELLGEEAYLCNLDCRYCVHSYEKNKWIGIKKYTK